MCEAALQQYAAAINNVTDNTTDLQPTALLFNQTYCAGTMYPRQADGSFTYVTPNSYQVPSGFVIRSLFVPFDVKLQLTSASGRSKTILGPQVISDTSQNFWDPLNLNYSLSSDPISLVQLTELVSWTQNRKSMCMGTAKYIGSNPLVRYNPTSERCDTYMEQDYCGNLTRKETDEACACFSDLAAVEKLSAEKNVTLPVTCFGQRCASLNSYKTRAMLSVPCSLQVCQQIIQNAGNNLIQGEYTIFCNGHYFDTDGNYTIDSTPTDNNGGSSGNSNSSGSKDGAPSTPQSEPFYNWIMLAVGCVLCILFVILAFSNLREDTTLLQQQTATMSQSSSPDESYYEYPESEFNV